jgi:enterochelin esterase-like enzyme
MVMTHVTFIRLLTVLLTLSASAARAQTYNFPILNAAMIPDCETAATDEPCRVRRELSAAEIDAHLIENPFSAWRDGTTMHIAFRSSSDRVRLSGSLQMPMARMVDSNRWLLSLKIPRINEAVLDIVAIADGAPTGVRAPRLLWRNQSLDNSPQFASGLIGSVRQYSVDSKVLGSPRNVSVYLPNNFKLGESIPLIFAADGQGLQSLVKELDASIGRGEAPRVVIIAAHSGGRASTGEDMRMQEYLIPPKTGTVNGVNRERFEQHAEFFTIELREWAKQEFGLGSAQSPKAIMGFSNGAALAVSLALREPSLYQSVMPLSFGYAPAEQYLENMPPTTRFFFAAGEFEPSFLRQSRQLSKKLSAIGADSTLRVYTDGHNQSMWRAALLDAVIWAFGTKTSRPEETLEFSGELSRVR